MTLRCYVGTAIECSRALELCNKLFGYPKDGANVGAGIHAPLTVSRTLLYSEVRVHPTLPATSALPLFSDVAAQLSRDSRLSAGEKTELTAFDAATQLVVFPEPTL